MKTHATLLVLLLSAFFVQAENWPQFRGSGAQNHATEKGLPVSWDEDSVAWKVEIPGSGWSSPVVWEDQVFLTTTTNEGANCHVLAVSAETGKLLWNVKVFEQEVLRKENKNSYATPTPCTDGKHVYAIFNDGGIAAVTVGGEIAWTNREVKFYSRHGLGASPILHHGKLVMPFDGSQRVDSASKWPDIPPEEKIGWQEPWDKSEVVAFDTETGKRLWTGKRGMSRIGHISPVVVTHGDRTEIVSASGDVIQGFDPENGERLWSVRCEGEGVAPSPAFGDGLIFVVSGYPERVTRAVKMGAEGESTATHILWKVKRGTPTLSSLLYVSPHLYAVTDGGVVTCYEGKSGEIVYRERLEGTYSASPLYADGKIYFTSEESLTTVVKAGAKFETLASNQLSGKCQASIAPSNGRLFIRTDRHLYGIGTGQ